jgi:hypothetical protein
MTLMERARKLDIAYNRFASLLWHLKNSENKLPKAFIMEFERTLQALKEAIE